MRKLFHWIKESLFINKKRVNEVEEQLRHISSERNLLACENEMLKRQNLEYQKMLSKEGIEHVEIFLDESTVKLRIGYVCEAAYGREGNRLSRHVCGQEITLESDYISFNVDDHSLIIEKGALKILEEEGNG